MYAAGLHVRALLHILERCLWKGKPAPPWDDLARFLIARYGLDHQRAAHTVGYVMDRLSEQWVRHEEMLLDAALEVHPEEANKPDLHAFRRSIEQAKRRPTKVEEGEWDGSLSPLWSVADDPELREFVRRVWQVAREEAARTADQVQPGVPGTVGVGSPAIGERTAPGGSDQTSL